MTCFRTIPTSMPLWSRSFRIGRAGAVAPLRWTVTPGGLISLDHAVWFHRPLRADGWMYFDVHSLINTGGRGLLRGVDLRRRGQIGSVDGARDVASARVTGGKEMVMADANLVRAIEELTDRIKKLDGTSENLREEIEKLTRKVEDLTDEMEKR